ncbi:MAG: sensor histidine kinase [Terriglobales bacterium]
MSKKLRLLNIEDSEDDSLLLRRHLTSAGYDLVFERVDTQEQLRAALETDSWDLIICDYVMPRFSALAALATVRKYERDIPFIVVSGAIGEETAVAAMRAGAHDYLMKNNLTRLAPAIQRELQEVTIRRERKRTEEALRTAEKLASVGRLAATIAHEVNNPLEAVTNILYLLSRRSLDSTSRHYLQMAEHELARVNQIVRQSLAFVRNSSKPEAVCVAALLDETLQLYAPKIRASNITITKKIDCDGDINAIGGELRQVFSNLIVNAIDAVGSGGRIRLHVFHCRDRWRHAEGIRVVVGDNGMGIRPEHQGQVFEPFFSTKAANGTGLGLWVSREIVQKYGGTITFRSSVHPHRTGTVFSVFLPTTGALAETRAAAATA